MACAAVTDFREIARRHRIAPINRAVDALLEAFTAGRAPPPLDRSRPGRRRYGSTAEERSVLQQIDDRRSRGCTWQSIADALTAAGARQRNGRPWTAGSLHSVARGRHAGG